MSHDEYTSVPAPQGVELEPCPVCGASAELWRRSHSPSSPTETAVCCSNGEPIGPQSEELHAGCLLYMPPDGFYRGTIREAVKYWGEYAKAVKVLRAAQAETDHLLSSPANAAHLARSIEQARKGRAQERQLVEPDDNIEAMRDRDEEAPSALLPKHIDALSDDDLWHIACVVTDLNGGSLFSVSHKQCTTEIRAAFMDPDAGRALLAALPAAALEAPRAALPEPVSSNPSAVSSNPERAALPEADGWISVKDRLPTHIYSVIGYVTEGPLTINGTSPMRDIVSYDPSRGNWLQSLGDRDAVVTVTHWQPLPDEPAAAPPLQISPSSDAGAVTAPREGSAA